YGQSKYDDHRSPSVSFTAGQAFLDGRLHVVGSAEYMENDGQLSQSSREWGRSNRSVLSRPPTPGLPTQFMVENARFLDRGFGGGTRFGSPLAGYQFGPGGTVLPFNYGDNARPNTVFAIGGDGDVIGPDANITPEIKRKSFYGRATYDLNDSTKVYFDALLAQSDIRSNGAMATYNLTISNDNAFLPDAMRTILDDAGLTSFQMRRLDGEMGYWGTEIETKVGRYGAGIEGELGDNWSWDAFVQYSRTDYRRDNINNSILERVTLGADAVVNPDT